MDPFVKQTLDSKGWLPVYTGLKSPSAAKIREFYSNVIFHSTVSDGHFLTTWIQGEEYQITMKVVANALSVPLVNHPTYLYSESPSLDDFMSLLDYLDSR